MHLIHETLLIKNAVAGAEILRRCKAFFGVFDTTRYFSGTLVKPLTRLGGGMLRFIDRSGEWTV
ncbi:MAG: hypothetical protein D8M52_09235 [Chlorobi bacterium]|nr:hypothetical protein [Chlorobiota bacterium]